MFFSLIFLWHWNGGKDINTETIMKSRVGKPVETFVSFQSQIEIPLSVFDWLVWFIFCGWFRLQCHSIVWNFISRCSEQCVDNCWCNNLCMTSQISYPDSDTQLRITLEFQQVSTPGICNCAGAIDGLHFWMLMPRIKQAKAWVLIRRGSSMIESTSLGLNVRLFQIVMGSF